MMGAGVEANTEHVPVAGGRSDVDFEVEGVRCAAWLFEPAGNGPYPAILMAPGLGSTRHESLEPFVERFVAEGFAVMLFDYRFFGESDGEPRQQLDFRMQRADWRAALAHLRELPQIDAGQIFLWGNSYSGGHVIELAAADHDIKAVAALAPFSDGQTTLFARGPMLPLKTTIVGIRDMVNAKLGRGRNYMPVFGPKGSFAAMTLDNAAVNYPAIIGKDSKFENRVTAWGTFITPYFRPTRKAANVRAPILMQIADDDESSSPKAAIKMAAKPPHAELSRYPGGHFAVFSDPVFSHVLDEQAAFFKRHLG